MKQILVLLLAASMGLACNAKAPTPTEKPVPANPKVLVAYFSRAGENHSVGVVEVGNTQKMAEEIH